MTKNYIEKHFRNHNIEIVELKETGVFTIRHMYTKNCLGVTGRSLNELHRKYFGYA